MFTNVYGPQLLDDKKRMITTFENLGERNLNSHWILAGDFNIIVTLAGKKGVRRLDRDAEVFPSFIEKTNVEYCWKQDESERKVILGRKACTRRETTERKSRMHACMEDLTMLGLGFL
jgi:hypothetical protein